MNFKFLIFSLLTLFTLKGFAKNSECISINKFKKTTIVVASNGSGNFLTVQEAINSVSLPNSKEVIIYIKNGIYKEKIEVPQGKNNITLIGEDKFKTILTYDDFASKKDSEGKGIGTSGSYSFAINSDSFKAVNITFENSAGPVGQAVAVRIDGDKVAFENCRFIGFQDTVYTRAETSRQYYRNCYIEGATDFIFGASTALFEDCEIFSKKGGNYITAASTTVNKGYGYVFINCKLKGDADKSSVFLGRPWRNNARTVFIGCEMGDHINPAGWHNWNKPEAETTTFYAEYKCSGSGATTSSRVKWSHTLTEEQFKNDYNVKKILNGWKPSKYKGKIKY